MRINLNKFFSSHLPLFLSVILALGALGAYYIYREAKLAQSAWYSSSSGTWNFRQKIVIDHTKVSTASSTTLTNFPVLISTTNVFFKDITNGGHVGKSDGSDIVFTSGDQTTKLPHELEYYASSTGQLIAWVKVPNLSPNTDTTIYMYYGNQAASDQSNKTAVWDSNYQLVWHLPNGSTLTANDSTSNANNASTINMSAGSGKIDGGAVSGSNTYIAKSSFAMSSSTSGTIEAWVYSTNFNQNGTISNQTNWSDSWEFMFESGNLKFRDHYLSDFNTLSVSLPSNNNWHHLVATLNGSIGTIYIDGVLAGSTGGFTAGFSTSAAAMQLAGRVGDISYTLNGSVDEYRISKVARSADWIVTEYNNQNSPSTFISWGGEETQPTAQVKGGWYNASWSYRKKIVINHTQVSGTSTLTNFPVVVSINSDPLLKFTGSGGHVASSTGADILFTASDGVTKLNYEREYYASSTGQLVAWVQIPSLSPLADTVLYLYYGNASASEQQNASGTWDSNYKGVWHFPNGSSLTVNDSTSNAANGSINGGVTATSGQLDGGASFNGSSGYISNSNAAAFSSLGTSAYTVEAWVKTNTSSTNKKIISKMDSLNINSGFDFVINYSSAGTIGIGNAGFIKYTGNVNVNNNVWHHIVGMYDGSGNSSGLSVYLDGQQQTLSSIAGSFVMGTNNKAVLLGQSDFLAGGEYYSGSMDEPRVLSGTKTSDWIKTEYNNQSSPSSFTTVAGEEGQTKTSFNSAWYSSDWRYRKPIVIDRNKVNTATGTTTPLTNFPVFISLTDTDVKNNASTTGADVLFTASDGLTKLNHELEYYSSSTGQLAAWVQVPSLAKTTDTVIYMYFGNTSANAQQNKNSTWDSTFQGVWHFTEGSGSTANDSTANAIAGSNTATSWVNGPWNFTGALDYSSNGATNMGHPAAINDLANWTYSAWFNTGNNSVNQTVMQKSNDKGFGPVAPGANGQYKGSYVNWSGKDAAIQTAGGVIQNGPWYYGTLTYTGNVLSLYLNGALIGTDTTGGSHGSDSSGDLSVGSGAFGYLRGAVAEPRIASVSRSADWIATEYSNQSSPQTFLAVGGLQSQNKTSGEGVSNRGSGPGWYASGGTWTNRRSITIDHNKVGAGTTTALTNFPMLFSTTDNEFKYTGFGGKVGKSDGTDVLFTAGDGTTKLNHEIEYYASSTGQLIIWVQIPSLSPSVDTQIFMYYGNAVSGNQQNITSTWDSNYKGVWHLPNGISLTANDSTSNGSNGSLVNTPTAVSGKIDGGANFVNTSQQRIDITDNSNFDNVAQGDWTIETWIKDTDRGNIGWPFYVSIGNNETGIGQEIGRFSIVSRDALKGTYGVLDGTKDANWAHIVATKSGSTFSFYFNGVSQPNLGGTDSGYAVSGTHIMGPGYPGGSSGGYIDGKIDEVRVSNLARSPDWIATEYNNQFSPGTFYALSGSNSQTRSTGVPLIKNRGGVKFH